MRIHTRATIMERERSHHYTIMSSPVCPHCHHAKTRRLRAENRGDERKTSKNARVTVSATCTCFVFLHTDFRGKERLLAV